MGKDFKTKLDAIFYPESIAIVGASNKFAKWGSFLTAHTLGGGYLGRIFPINPKEKEIFGREVYRSLKDIPGPVDLAYICTPVDSVYSVIKECIEKRVKGIVVITSGFSETGADGSAKEKEIVGLVEEARIPMVGPNTMGVMCTQKKLYSTGAPIYPKRGAVSFVSQSGNLGVQMIEWAEMQSIGMSKFVGSGNEGSLKKEDYLAYFGNDDDTEVILLYVEGLERGDSFFDVISDVTKRKPVIALKGGRTDEGGAAAASHTGSMASNNVILRSAFRQLGVIEVGTPADMLDISMAFDNLPLPRGDRVGIVTLGGGWGVITCDELVENGLNIATLGPDVIEALDKILPPFWSRGNPVDLVGQINPEVYKRSVEEVTRSEDVDAVICLGIVGISNAGLRSFSISAKMADLDNQEYTIRKAEYKLQDIEREFLDKVNELMNEYEKPILNVSLSAEGKRVRFQSKTGYSEVVYATPEKAVMSLVAMHNYYRYLKNHGYME
jgi:acyl-CoA synthetase (NDP forming)